MKPTIPCPLVVVCVLAVAADSSAQSISLDASGTRGAIAVVSGPVRAGSRTTARDPQDSARSRPAAPRITVLAGVGNDLGWFGGQAEAYFSGGRLSAFLGLGYTPDVEGGNPTGATVATGLRAYTAGSNHRAFGEASLSQIAVTTPNGGRHYGPGIQLGYQYAADGGFTLLVSGGVGVALGVSQEVSGSTIGALLNLRVGYTWRR